jgi:hypothetical protein
MSSTPEGLEEPGAAFMAKLNVAEILAFELFSALAKNCTVLPVCRE